MVGIWAGLLVLTVGWRAVELDQGVRGDSDLASLRYGPQHELGHLVFVESLTDRLDRHVHRREVLLKSLDRALMEAHGVKDRRLTH